MNLPPSDGSQENKDSEATSGAPQAERRQRQRSVADVRGRALPEESLSVDHTSGRTLSDQLYDGIQQAIITAQFMAGQRMPSSRELAEQLQISRAIVTDCYAQLVSEGYLDARAGSGTFVAWQLPADEQNEPGEGEHTGDTQLRLSNFGQALALAHRESHVSYESAINLSRCQPALDHEFMFEWARVVGRCCRRMDYSQVTSHNDSLGYLPLREAIARRQDRLRGAKCSASQVMILSGATQAFDLVARLHVEKGDNVRVENPGKSDVWAIFTANGANICPAAVDEAGVVVSSLGKLSDRCDRLVYVTPAHQFPTGVVLALRRRLELLSWADRHGTFILEDDRDSEFRYCGKPIPALQGLDKNGSIIYLGSFATTMFPAVSIAYLVLPLMLVPFYARVATLLADQVPLLLQDAMSEFIEGGYLDRHVKELRSLYQQRRLAMVNSLNKHLESRVTVHGDNAGLSMIVQFHTELSDCEIAEKAARCGVGIISTAGYYSGNGMSGQFILGFGDLSLEQIDEGIGRLAGVLVK